MRTSAFASLILTLSALFSGTALAGGFYIENPSNEKVYLHVYATISTWENSEGQGSYNVTTRAFHGPFKIQPRTRQWIPVGADVDAVTRLYVNAVNDFGQDRIGGAINKDPNFTVHRRNCRIVSGRATCVGDPAPTSMVKKIYDDNWTLGFFIANDFRDGGTVTLP